MLSRVRETWARFLALFRRDRLDRDLDEDLATHLALLTGDLVARGMDPETARREARLRFGTVDSAKERHRDARAMRWIESALQDLRYAARLLRRQPLLTSAVVLTLGLGIGAPTSVLSLLNAMAFRVQASADPDAYFRVVRAGRNASGSARLEEYFALRDGSRMVRELAVWSRDSLRSPIGPDNPERVIGLLVSCNLFRMTGVTAPVTGRLFVEDDCASPVPVAIVSEGLWRRRFGGDPSIVGQSLRYAGAAVMVIGVVNAPPIDQQADDPYLSPDLWFPYSAQPALKEGSGWGKYFEHMRRERMWEVGGLLAVGSSRAAVQAEFRAIEAAAAFAPSEDSHGAASDPIVVTDGTRWSSQPWMVAALFAIALVLPTLFMLTACVNVAGLLLPRAIARQREMAVRLSLGTSRRRLIHMLLIESLLLSGLGTAVSLVLVYSLPPLLVRFFDAEGMFGAAETLAPDWRVFAGLGVACLTAAIISGVTPALESLNPKLADSLKTPRHRTLGSRGVRARRLFVAAQIGVSMVLLIVAVTAARATVRLAEPGFRTGGLLVADLRAQQKPAVALTTAADALAMTAGVARVAYTELPPLVTETAVRVRVPGHAEIVSPMASDVSPGYFDVLDIPILAGRSLQRHDAAAGDMPIVVSRQFARRFFGEANPLGATVEEYQSLAPNQQPLRRMTIVGLAGDRDVGLSRLGPVLTDGSIIYRPIDPAATSGVVLIDAPGDPAAAAATVRGVLGPLTATPAAVRPFRSMLDERAVPVQRLQVVLLAMGLLSLLLVVIGLVGAVWAESNERRKEFAIRSALGATPAQVRQRVLLAGARPMPIAISAGLLASWAALKNAEAARLLPLSSLASDPAPYAAITALVVIVTIGVLLAVAHPAGRRDPVVALRED